MYTIIQRWKLLPVGEPLRQVAIYKYRYKYSVCYSRHRQESGDTRETCT